MNPIGYFTALPLLMFGCAAQAQSNAEICATLASWSQGAADIQISEAVYYTNRALPAGPPGSAELVLPPHCHVAGAFERRTGSDGKDYAINFALNLPDNWNGRYLFQGGGGLNGVVREPLGNQNTGEQSALVQGYAVVSNDTGHASSGFDASFLADQQAMLNFYYEANAKVVNQTRPMVEAYYRQPARHSYFVGCSTGGREGMMMAQRYPHLFDGIVSGAPAMRTGISNLALRWFSVELGKAANTNPRDPFTDTEQVLIMDTLLAQCDVLDGQADKLIFNRSACAFDPVALACSTNAGQQCLADDKAAALARAIGGPMTSAGDPVYVPFPWDSGLDDAGRVSGLLLAGGNPPEGPNGADMSEQNVDAEYIAAMAADLSLGDTATQYNLSEFISEGGKQLFFHGEADPWFSANETERYFNAMTASNAAVKSVEDYSRLYLVPGMGHCAGGEQTLDTFDMLTPLVEWVENNKAPGSIIATGKSMPGQSRPLCPYPGYAHFEGGNAAEANSYSCRTP